MTFADSRRDTVPVQLPNGAIVIQIRSHSDDLAATLVGRSSKKSRNEAMAILAH